MTPKGALIYNIPRSVCETQSCAVGIKGGNGFLGTSGHRQMMDPSVMNLQHRLVLELSVGLSFDQRQAQLHNGGLIYFGSSYKHCQRDLADLNFLGRNEVPRVLKSPMTPSFLD